LPNLRAGEALIASGRAGHVLSICVEVCSAAFYLDDDIGVLVSACLFGDGAAAAVLSPAPRAGARAVEWKSAATLTNPGERDALRFEQRNGMLRNILTLPVPKLAAQHARAVLDDALARESMRREDVDAWIVHAGGRRVLEELRREIGFPAARRRGARRCCAITAISPAPSSSSCCRPRLRGGAKGGWWWMTSFGAGFSCHGALLRVA
jgi:alkylresorcinol/alkylpyrone synthase